MFVNHNALAPSTLAVWSRGGLDTLVKVAPIGYWPDPARVIGSCTTLRFLVGRTPAEMELIVRLDPGMRLVNGAEIFRVSPLPSAAEFELKAYSSFRGEASAAELNAVSHPTYPPTRGAPQWEVARVRQDRLVRITSVTRDQILAFDARRLPPVAAPHAP
jgi:hypothetical protein